MIDNVGNVVALVAVLVVAAGLFCLAYRDYTTHSQFTVKGLWAAALGTTAFGFLAKFLFEKCARFDKSTTTDAGADTSLAQENSLGEGGSGRGSTTRYAAADSQPGTPMPKRWWRKWGKK